MSRCLTENKLRSSFGYVLVHNSLFKLLSIFFLPCRFFAYILWFLIIRFYEFGVCLFLTLSLGFCFLFSILVWILFCFVFFFLFFFVLFCFAFWFCGFVFVFWDRVSLYSPGYPGTHFVEQAGLELRNQPASASQVLGLKACTTMPIWFEFFIWLFFSRKREKEDMEMEQWESRRIWEEIKEGRTWSESFVWCKCFCSFKIRGGLEPQRRLWIRNNLEIVRELL